MMGRDYKVDHRIEKRFLWFWYQNHLLFYPQQSPYFPTPMDKKTARWEMWSQNDLHSKKLITFFSSTPLLRSSSKLCDESISHLEKLTTAQKYVKFDPQGYYILLVCRHYIMNILPQSTFFFTIFTDEERDNLFTALRYDLHWIFMGSTKQVISCGKESECYCLVAGVEVIFPYITFSVFSSWWNYFLFCVHYVFGTCHFEPNVFLIEFAFFDN